MTADLTAAYAQCRRINAQHGRSYYLATLLLPAWKRPPIHALYALARVADDIVDHPGADPAGTLDDLQRRLRAGDGRDAVLTAVRDTIDRWDISWTLFDDFFDSMRMDLRVSSYRSWSDVLGYMHGSAAVIGLQTLPILEPLPGLSDVAAPYARDLGLGFQLTNFLRDIGEDLDRGRLYLPQEDLDRFGVTRGQLERRDLDDRVRALLDFEIQRARGLLATAALGIRLLHPTSRDCVRTALLLYGGILDEIERADYRVLDRRVSVGAGRRATLAVTGLGRAWLARRPHHNHHANVCSTSEKPNATSSIGA
ncbi:MAG: 15-cis-phytoene synthase [Frankiaceae bacterium]|jgi:phytoene synthase|nr:15-cis-phytoene synthase [Frankiaceae bacterium]